MATQEEKAVIDPMLVVEAFPQERGVESSGPFLRHL
jgi:hypothetical protein